MHPRPVLEFAPFLRLPLIAQHVPAGFPSPAADYVETRIDLNKELIKHPSFTFYAYAEGLSMYPTIHPGDLLIIDRKAERPNNCIVMAAIHNEYCIKRFFSFSDGSVEFRSDNPEYKTLNFTSEFEGELDIFGRVVWIVRDPRMV
jgi:DNA polymerase V